MRSAVPLLLLAAALPSGAQTFPERLRQFRPSFPPDIIMRENVVRDAPRVDPIHARIETDNETTRVLRINLDAGRQIPLHDDRAGVLVCLTECHLSFNGGEEVHLRPGQTRWMTDDRRVTRNIGGSAVEVLYIESKKAGE